MTDHDDSEVVRKQMAQRVRQLEDVAELTTLIAAYGHAADAGAADAVAELWSDDGVFEVQSGGRWVGRDEIAEVYRGKEHRQLIEHGCGHVMAPPQVEVDGDSARAWNHSMLVRFDPESGRFEVRRLAANEWRFVRRPEGWRIVSRVNRLLDGSADARRLFENAARY